MAGFKQGRSTLEQVAQRIANDPVIMTRIREAEERLDRGEGTPAENLLWKVHEARAKKKIAISGQAAISEKETVAAI